MYTYILYKLKNHLSLVMNIFLIYMALFDYMFDMLFDVLEHSIYP